MQWSQPWTFSSVVLLPELHNSPALIVALCSLSRPLVGVYVAELEGLL